MAAVVFASTAVGGYGTECTLPEGGGGIQLAVAGEGKGVARAHKTKQAGGGGVGNFSHKHSPISAWFHCFLIIII